MFFNLEERMQIYMIHILFEEFKRRNFDEKVEEPFHRFEFLDFRFCF